jgi:uncharacterized membrane protein
VPAVAATVGLGELRRRREARLGGDDGEESANVSRLKASSMGVAVAGAGLLGSAGERRLADAVGTGASRLLGGHPALWRPVGHAVSLALIAGATRAVMHQAFRRIERMQESVEPALDIPPPVATVSGSLDSHVPFETLARAGRRFVWNLTTADRIEAVMGERAVRQPARLYVGLESADTDEARVALALRELDRTGAWDRAWLMVALPTGTGYVNYAAATILELLTRGDCASIAMQYAARPSPLSLDRVAEGRAHARLLLDAIGARLRELPEDRRPRVLLFGESLGAWTSQDAFIDRGTRGLVEAGVDRAIWIGTPHFSKWKEQVLRDDGVAIDHDLVGVFSRIEEWRAVPASEREHIRFVMITHHDDGVALFGPELFIEAPDWLGDAGNRPDGAPKGMRWMPTTTFFQVLVDMKNAAQVVPGVLAAKGHDYRADLLPFFHETLGLTASEEQLASVTAALVQSELRRARWMENHRSADTSLSATLARRWIDQEREAGRDPGEVLVQAFRTLLEETDAATPGDDVGVSPDAPTTGRP